MKLKKEQYGQLVATVLETILIINFLIFIDAWILPQKNINDQIIKKSKLESRKGHHLGYNYLTQNRYNISTQKKPIWEVDVFIKQSYIFNNITQVKTNKRNYIEDLMSGINGPTKFFMIGFHVTAILSIILLEFYKNLTENGFHNIILFNSFLIILIFYFYIKTS